jgi:hypothetical protein
VTSKASIREPARPSRFAAADDDVPGTHRLPPDAQLAQREARERDLHDGEVAQQLLHGPVHDRGVLGDPAVVVAVVEEHGGAEREHAGARLQATCEHAVREPAEVEVVDLVPVLADDLPDQPFARVGALLAGGLHQELPRVRHGAEDALPAVRHVETGRTELAERLPVLVGQPEQLADDQERHRERERWHQVDRAGGRRLLLHHVELAFHDLGDLGAQPLEAPHGELRGEQLPQSGVLGRVGEPQPADVTVGHRPLAAHERPDVVAVAAGVGQHLLDLALPGHQPDVHAEERRQLRHGRLLAQLPDPVHRIGAHPLQRPSQVVGHLVELRQVDPLRADAGQHQPTDPRAEVGREARHWSSCARRVGGGSGRA